MKILRDKIAVVTGASSGIGRAAALLFAREGAHVVATARRQAELDLVVDEIRAADGTATAVAGDIGDEPFIAELVATIRESHGRLDVAFNNAGTLGAIGPITDIELDDWNETVRVNLTSAYLLAKHQVPLMAERGGAMVFTSTFVGHTVGLPGMAAYAASKSGLLGLARVLASELGDRGIRVNALLPGGTDTPMGRSVASSPEALRYVERLHALGRIASPDEIAHSALFLVSDAARFTTGAAMLVDGGVSIHRPR
jgi:NAD(P)-dependent dehydrogenase (short-subunit alcohol dehydrogenase family)